MADDARFLDEALARGAACQFLGEQLDGDQAADHGVVGASYTSMSAAADNFQDFVASDLHGDISLRLASFGSEMILPEKAVGANEASVLFLQVRRY